MPRGDGAGPAGGGGPGTGRGAVSGGGGGGRGGGFAMGPGGNCICPNCGKQVAHQRGTPCYEVKCSACDATMARQR